MKILVFEFHQETNTFNPVTAGLDRFYADTPPQGQAGLERCRAGIGMARGIVEVLEAAGAEVVPGVFLRAGSGGRVQDSVFEFLWNHVEATLASAGAVEGACLSLHGATCTESLDDACGELLARLRARLGNVPICAGFDLHANITPKILEAADGICGYQTYPHVDQRETGRRTARMCLDLLAGKPRFRANVSIPMLLPPAGYSTGYGPFQALTHRAKTLPLVDFTLFPVQPWLDIPVIASQVVTYAETPEAAQAQAESLAKEFYENREGYQPKLTAPEEIFEAARANKSGKPVLLVDAADSTNGGAAGDSPAVALKLLEHAPELRSCMFVVDPEAAEAAFRMGVGAEGEFTLGASMTPGIPGPLKAVGRVLSLHDGYFRCEGPANRGGLNFIGRSAVVRFGNVDILICRRGSSSGDPQLLRHFGMEPALYNLVVVKANTSFLVPYGPISDLVYYADTPGAGASNLLQLQWNKLPQGLYPFC